MRKFSRFLAPLLFFVSLIAFAFTAAADESSDCDISKVPEKDYVDHAVRVINLISTYVPEEADRQFNQAKEFFAEPALSEFQSTMLSTELAAIKETKRKQHFSHDPKLVKFERFLPAGVVVVRIPGIRNRFLGEKPLPPDEIAYYVKLKPNCQNGGVTPPPLVVDLRLRHALPARGQVPEEQVGMRRRISADDAYGDLIQAFKNDIERTKKDSAELSGVVAKNSAEIKEHKTRITSVLETIVSKLEGMDKRINALNEEVQQLRKEIREMKK